VIAAIAKKLNLGDPATVDFWSNEERLVLVRRLWRCRI
jgi:hypothetical protein